MGTEALLVLLGAGLAVEWASLGQFMLARPIVAGFLAGSLVGDPGAGLIVGAVLELFYLPAVPIGAGRYPEPGPATVVAVQTAAFAGGAGSIALGVFSGLALGLLGGWAQEQTRGVVSRLVPRPDERGLAGRLTLAQWAGLVIAGARGALLTSLGLALAAGLGPPAGAVWPLGPTETLLLLAVASCIPMGSLLSTLGGVRRRGTWMALGIGVGVVLGALA